MENFIAAFISEFAPQVCGYIMLAIAGYLGIFAAKFCRAHFDNDTKKAVAKTVVKAVEQIYKDIHGEQKLKKALEFAEKLLAKKGITFDADEMMLLIEAAVCEMNKNFKKTYSGPQQGFTECTNLADITI